ncbi:MAG TPA: methyltransferase domain-containing protein [Acidimicrobiales bacterium]|nr:methyltransferase domain-containing protein [Acidimicrobiales bacterium]
MKEYPSRYEEHSSHASAMRLLARSGCDGGVLLDLGCGRSPLAEVATEAGFEYIGLDIDEHALAELEGRGFEVHPVDLVTPGVADRLGAVVGDRKLGAVLLLDVLEHVVDPGALLREVNSLFTEMGVIDAQLVVSIPNVTHFDLGAKLLAGRWDYLDTGLLDDTHLRFFDEWGYGRLFSSNGWREADRDDVELEYSEQRFPAEAPFVRPGVPAREFLLGLRMLAEPNGLTYQFVRRFQLDNSVTAPTPREPESLRRDVFVSVVVDLPSGGDVVPLVGDMSRQTSGQFEVIVAVDPGASVVDLAAVEAQLDGRCARVITVAGATSAERLRAAVGAAGGRYLCLLAPDTRVAPAWIERLAKAELANPGSVLVAGATCLPGKVGEPAPETFEELLGPATKRLAQNWVELLSVEETGDVVTQAFAVPTDALVTTSLDLAGERAGAPAGALVRAVELCGLAHCDDVCVAVPRTRVLDGAHQMSLVRDELSERPFLLPSGSFAAVLELREVLRRERAGRVVSDAALVAAEASAQALAAQVERLDRELHVARTAMFEAEKRGAVGRLIRIAKRALGQ